MSNIKTNDATSKSAGALTGVETGNDPISEKSELKAQLNVIKAQKRDLNNQIKECDRQEKAIQKRLAPATKAKSGKSKGKGKSTSTSTKKKAGKK